MPKNDTTIIPRDESRIKQAIQVGYVEMERIVDEIVTKEFNRLGEVLMKQDYNVEIILFDTESEIDGKLHLCGAGLSITRDTMKNAIVYTGDPYNFQFSIQTQNFANKSQESIVEYHKLTPKWFHNNLKQFIADSFRDVDVSEIENMFNDDWLLMEGPFQVKVKTVTGDYEVVAEEDTIDRAFQVSSYAAELHYHEQDLIVTDKNGKEVA